MSYEATRDRVECYFDGTATKVWADLTSDVPVSGIRATVRAGRDEMRAALLGRLGADLHGLRILDAGCGTGALAVELARRGAEVVAIDISPRLVAIARERCPAEVAPRIAFHSGDMLDGRFGRIDHAVAMDSLIYYGAETVAAMLGRLLPRVSRSILLTLPPRTPMTMAMWRVGRLFPRTDRSPLMVPETAARLDRALGPKAGATRFAEIRRGFYLSSAIEVMRC